MASFSDQISQFTPYVSRLPLIQEMAQVGMEKQQKYDQGVQKIQSQIDNVAGLDVIHPLQKQYLQSKLDELGNNLRGVAAGDFSNNQLVNSVGGMATSIVKDPVIQNAVYSTQKIRQGMNDLQAARKAGTASPQNEWDYNQQVNGYLGNKDLKSTFTGEYKQYVDVGKKLRDVADKVHEIDNTIETPYRRDASGKVITDRNGNPIVDEAMLSIKTKGKPAEKILSTFYDSLDEKDLDQMRIDARYHYRGATADTFKQEIEDNYKTSKDLLSSEIVNTNVALNDPKLSTADKAALKAKLNTLTTARDSGDLEKETQNQLAQIDRVHDDDSLKYQIYSKKYLSGLAKDLSYQSYQQEIKANPYFQAQMQQKQLQAQYDKMRQDDRHFNMTYAQTERKMAFEQAKAAGTQPIVTPDPLSTAGERPTLDALDGQINNSKAALNVLNGDYASKIFNKPTDKGLTVTEKQKILDKLAADYQTNPSMHLDNIQREYLEKRRGFEMDIAQKNNLYADVKAKTTQFDKQLDDVLNQYKGVTFSNGQTMYTARQLYDVASDYFNSMKTSQIGGGQYGATASSVDRNAFLKKYEGSNKYQAALAFVNRGNENTPTQNVIYKQALNVYNAADQAAANINNQRVKTQGDLLAARMPEFQTASGALSKENKPDMDRTQQLIAHATDLYNIEGALDSDTKRDFNPATINKWQQDPKIAKTLDYIIKKKYDGSAQLIVQNGEQRQIIPMDYKTFGTFYPQYAKSNPLNSIKSMVLSSPNHTTNALGATDATGAVNAYFSGFNIPQLADTKIAPLVRLDVEGSPSNNGSADDQYQVRMYVNNNGHWVDRILNDKGYANEAGVQAILNSIGTKTVEDVLKNR